MKNYEQESLYNTARRQPVLRGRATRFAGSPDDLHHAYRINPLRTMRRGCLDEHESTEAGETRLSFSVPHQCDVQHRSSRLRGAGYYGWRCAGRHRHGSGYAGSASGWRFFGNSGQITSVLTAIRDFVYPPTSAFPVRSLTSVAEQLYAQFEAGKGCGIALAALGVPPGAIAGICNAAPALGIDIAQYLGRVL